MGNKKVGRILISDFSALATQQYSTRMQRLRFGYNVVKRKPGQFGQESYRPGHCLGRETAVRRGYLLIVKFILRRRGSLLQSLTILETPLAAVDFCFTQTRRADTT